MVRINYYIQFMLVIGVIGLLLLVLSTENNQILLLLYFQTFVGVTQVLSGLLLFVGGNRSATKLYLRLTFVYILLMSVVVSMESKLPIGELYLKIGILVLPWALAIYYWFISYQLYKAK